jgi:hypothetical protein
VQLQTVRKKELSELVVSLTTVMEQGVNIKFCIKLGKTPTETYEMLQTDYGD